MPSVLLYKLSLQEFCQYLSNFLNKNLSSYSVKIFLNIPPDTKTASTDFKTVGVRATFLNLVNKANSFSEKPASGPINII